MSPDDRLLARLSRLARLAPPPELEPTLERQLRAILDYVAVLEEVDAPDEAAPTGAPGALREDVPRPSLERDDALANAPDTIDGHLRVPRVLD